MLLKKKYFLYSKIYVESDLLQAFSKVMKVFIGCEISRVSRNSNQLITQLQKPKTTHMVDDHTVWMESLPPELLK